MTLLSRGITSSQQGLSYLDKAIAKSEADDKEFQTNLDTYNDLLSGVKSGGTYLGRASRNILNEYANAFESAIDMYAADPSAENEQRIQQLKLQTKDFYNRAVASRQNSLLQLKGVREDPAAYSVSLAKAQQKFASIEDADPTARFDMNTMSMYVGDNRSEQLLGNIGYYNGDEPMFFDKAAQIGPIQVEGAWGAENLERFYDFIDATIPDDQPNVGKERIIEAFMNTARPTSSAYQETAIYNYLQDIKGVDLTKIESETELRDRILEVRNNGAELTAALEHMAGLEYKYMVGAKNAKEQAKASRLFNETFRGDTESREPRPEEPPYAYTNTGETGASTRYSDPYAGVEGVRMLNKPMGAGTEEGDIAGLDHYAGELGQLVGYDVDALGRIVALVHSFEPDPDDEEKSIMTPEFIVLDGDAEDPRMNDLYNNLRSKIRRDGMFSILQVESKLRMAQHEKDENKRRIAEAYANSESVETPAEFQITVTPEEVRAATGPSLRQRQFERNEEQRLQEYREASPAERQEVIALSELPQNIRQSYFSDEDKNEDGTYKIPEGATIGGGNDIIVNGEKVGELVTRMNYETGKYENRGMVPIQKSGLQKFFEGVGRLFGGSEGAAERYIDAKRKIEIEDTPIGPVDNSAEILARAESERLFGGAGSGVIDNIFKEEGYSAEGTIVDVPSSMNSGVTIGGLDLGSKAGNAQEKLDILSKYIPEDQIKALESLQGLVGADARAALGDSLKTGELDPSTWDLTDDTLRQIQSDFVSSNTMPSIARKMGVSAEDLRTLPEQVLTAITSMEFMTPGRKGGALEAVAKAMKSGSREDWLAAADMYESYYGSEAKVKEKLKDGRILRGNVNRAKRAAELIRSVYS